MAYLNLVINQRSADFVTALSQCAQELLVGFKDATFTLFPSERAKETLSALVSCKPPVELKLDPPEWAPR